MRKLAIINSFWLKIIAFVTMTIDHVGIFLLNYYRSNPDCVNVGNAFRIVGRICFPIIILLLVEGIRKSKHPLAYIGRLAFMMVLIMIPQAILAYTYDAFIGNVGSPFIDLTFIGLALYLIKRKDKYTWLCAFPILFIVFSEVLFSVEGIYHITINWFPAMFRASYATYGLLMALGFYLVYPFMLKYIKRDPSNAGIEDNVIVSTKTYQGFVNIGVCVVILFINIIYYGLSYITVNNTSIINSLNISVQTWSLLAMIPLLFYSGERGYNKKWFQYGSYFYFPVHLVIIWLIFYLLQR